MFGGSEGLEDGVYLRLVDLRRARAGTTTLDRTCACTWRSPPSRYLVSARTLLKHYLTIAHAWATYSDVSEATTELVSVRWDREISVD